MVNLALAWLRRNLAWSSSRAAWRERLGLGLVLAGTGVLGWHTGNLALAQQIFLWGLWLLLLTVLLRRGWYTLCGPILLYDLVRTTRRSRYTLYRFYAYFVIVLLVFFFAVWYWRQRDVSRLSLKENAEFAAAFFYFFLGLQLLMATLLTPAYTAGILTEEKERRTLEFFEAKCKLHFKQDAVASAAYLAIAVPFVGVPFSPRTFSVIFSASQPAGLIGQERLVDVDVTRAEEELAIGDLPAWLEGGVEVSHGNLRRIKLKVIKRPPQGLSRHILLIKSKTDPRRVVPLPVLALSLPRPAGAPSPPQR